MSLELISIKRKDGAHVSIYATDCAMGYEVPVRTGNDEIDDEHEVYACDCPSSALDALMLESDMEQNIFNLTCVASRLEHGFNHEHPQHEIMTQALARIQNALGQDDGGTAGVFFSGKDEDWARLDYNWRVGELSKYVQTELNLNCQSWGE